MNKINPIFEALSNVDERHIPVTKAKRPAKKMKIALTAAAAAAAVALLAGFTTAVVKGKHVFSFNKGGSIEQEFNLDLKSRELPIPDEFKPPNGETFFYDSVDLTPRELFEKFGITPPMNDNFSDVADEKPIVDIYTDGNHDNVKLQYVLYNKAVDKNVHFTAQYYSNAEKMTLQAHYGLLPGEPSEVVTLNNGASCMVTACRAVFSYDGACYELFLPSDESMIPDNIGELTVDEQKKIFLEAMPGIDAVKQVLADLGLL